MLGSEKLKRSILDLHDGSGEVKKVQIGSL